MIRVTCLQHALPRRHRLPAVPVLVGVIALLALVWGPGPHTAHAAEFVTPAGINLQAEEAVLKERISRIVKGVVGDDLVDVEVSVRYIRTDGGQGERIKLPGVNAYIQPSTTGTGASVVAGYARVRQVLVVVSDHVTAPPEALAQEIRMQANLNPRRGDAVRVIKVPEAKPGAKQAGLTAAAGGEPKADQGLDADAQRLAKRLRDEEAKQKTQQALGKIIAQGSLSEAQSTTYLIKAREAYFNGNYGRALDQILHSISQNPNNPQAYAMLGSLYYAVDWKQLALKYWEKSLTLDPDNHDVEDLVAKLRSSPK